MQSQRPPAAERGWLRTECIPQLGGVDGRCVGLSQGEAQDERHAQHHEAPVDLWDVDLPAHPAGGVHDAHAWEAIQRHGLRDD